MIRSVLALSLVVSIVVAQSGCSTCAQQGTGSYAAVQTRSGQCLPNGQPCQWDTSLGDCCSTYCYQQAGQSMGVCQDRPASSQGQISQRNPPTNEQTGCTTCGTRQDYPSAQTGSGQCLPNGQPCQWDTSMGNCCSTYCYQQAGQSTGICQTRSGSPSQPVQSNPDTQPMYNPYPSYQSPQSQPCNTCQQNNPSNQNYGPSGPDSCLQNGQTCTYSGSMGNCCSGWCKQLQPQTTGTCQQPGNTGSSYQQGAQTSQPSSQIYYSPAATNSQSQQAGCLSNGQPCTWSGSMGNCCSGWCRQMENEATGTCSAKLNSGYLFRF